MFKIEQYSIKIMKPPDEFLCFQHKALRVRTDIGTCTGGSGLDPASTEAILITSITLINHKIN